VSFSEKKKKTKNKTKNKKTKEGNGKEVGDLFVWGQTRFWLRASRVRSLLHFFFCVLFFS